MKREEGMKRVCGFGLDSEKKNCGLGLAQPTWNQDRKKGWPDYQASPIESILIIAVGSMLTSNKSFAASRRHNRHFPTVKKPYLLHHVTRNPRQHASPPLSFILQGSFKSVKQKTVTMKRQTLAHSLLLLLLFAITVVVVDAALAGGWSPIKDLKDKHVVEIAEYAVAEHNKHEQSSLKLESIVKGESQVVAGTNYRLVLAVKGGAYKKYQAVVYERPWENFRNLTSFKPYKG
ncbi:unnamed protein product [Dovyalis caffra]|uniref:Cystatin domain-containing protein n=1 Tax=Dovyalis caffra TaxID=77055 RepID=A0AAV1S4K7_9ROSI|nr:unnamed protein product [Dovyalis caffra]